MLRDVIGDGDLEAPAAICEGLDACASPLHHNRVEGMPLSPSGFGKMAPWVFRLRRRGLAAGMNKPRGADEDAACGQLANNL